MWHEPLRSQRQEPDARPQDPDREAGRRTFMIVAATAILVVLAAWLLMPL